MSDYTNSHMYEQAWNSIVFNRATIDDEKDKYPGWEAHMAL